MVIDQRFLSSPEMIGQLNESLEEGVQVRTVKDVPLKLIICDGEVAMLPLRGRGADVSPSLVLRGGLVNIARSLFEVVWEQGRPYGATGLGLDAMDSSILRLLLAGLTDGGRPVGALLAHGATARPGVDPACWCEHPDTAGGGMRVTTVGPDSGRRRVGAVCEGRSSSSLRGRWVIALRVFGPVSSPG
ncbi:hypothetical protein [Streptomyces sp. NPDC049944]|uniref:hypothetical protein n=1 Tax=Streptomyces sp. NPDC049944 TaxID=3155657 RepID=UPI0034170F8B